MIRVFVMDRHEIVRSGLRSLLAETPDMALCGEASSGARLAASVEHSRADVLVLGVDADGDERPPTVADLLRSQRKPLPVVVFSTYPEGPHALAWLRAGARAYLSKAQPTRDLLAAIRKTHDGGRYITPALADFLFEYGLHPERHLEQILSIREMEIARALERGWRSVEIASRFGLSPSTVNTYVQRIKAKLGVRTILEIVRTLEHDRHGIA